MSPTGQTPPLTCPPKAPDPFDVPLMPPLYPPGYIPPGVVCSACSTTWPDVSGILVTTQPCGSSLWFSMRPWTAMHLQTDHGFFRLSVALPAVGWPPPGWHIVTYPTLEAWYADPQYEGGYPPAGVKKGEYIKRWGTIGPGDVVIVPLFNVVNLQVIFQMTDPGIYQRDTPPYDAYDWDWYSMTIGGLPPP